MTRAARRALMASAAIVTLWFVGPEYQWHGSVDRNLSAPYNNIAEMEGVNRSVREGVAINDVSPKEHIAITYGSLLQIGLGDKYIPDCHRLARSDYRRRLIGQIAFGLGEIGFGPAGIPFNGNPWGGGQCGGRPVILESNAYTRSLDFDVRVGLARVRRLRPDSLELVEPDVCPKLNSVGFELLGNSVVGGVEEPSTNRGCDSEHNRGGPKDYRPNRYRVFIASSLWFIALGIGAAGFLFGAWRRASGLLFLVALIAAGVIAAIGAAAI